MSKLYFYWGVMGAGKTIDAIRCVYNYKEKGLLPFVLKPRIDTRTENTIKSRTGSEIPCDIIDHNEDMLSLFIDFEMKYGHADVIIIDEAQFLTTDQVNALHYIVRSYDVPIICYGLKTDFQTHLFEGSKRLLELAENITEIKSICWCGSKATQNARVIDGKFIEVGEVVQIGANESYIPLCTKHYFNKQINKK